MTQAGQVTVQLTLDAKQYQEALEKADKKQNDFVKDTEKSGKAVDLFSVALKAVAFSSVIAGIQKLGKAITSSVEDFRAQDRALKSYANALKNAGVYTNQYASDIADLASEIQKYSNFGDEVIVQAVAVGQSFAGTTRITEDLIKAVVDLAAATEMDLQSAFTLVGKSIGSPTNALARYGVVLKEGMTAEQKMASITEQLGTKFTGQAKSMSNASEQLKNALSDLSEEIGGVFNPTVEKGQMFLQKYVEKMTQWVNSVRIARTEIKQLSMGELNKRLSDTINYIAELESGSYVKGYDVSVNEKTEGVYGDLYRKYKAEQDAIIKQMKFLKEQDAQTNPQNNLVKSLENTSKSTEKAKEKIKEYTDFVKQYQEEESKIANAQQAQEELGGVLGSFASDYKQRLEILTWYKDERIRLANEEFKTLDEKKKAFVELDKLNTLKIAQSEQEIWYTRAQDIKSIFSNTFSNLLSDYENFGDSMKQLALNLTNYLIGQMIQTAFTAQTVKSILSSVGGWYGVAINAVSGLFSHHTGYSMPKYHDGGNVPYSSYALGGTSEQLAILKGGERVLSPSENRSYENNQTTNNGGSNVVVFQINATDSKSFTDYAKQNETFFINMMRQAIKDNKAGMRSTIKAV